MHPRVNIAGLLNWGSSCKGFSLSILLLRFQLLFQLRKVTPKLDRLLHIDTDGCTSQMGEHVHLAEGMEQQLFRSARMGR